MFVVFDVGDGFPFSQEFSYQGFGISLWIYILSSDFMCSVISKWYPSFWGDDIKVILLATWNT